MAQGCQLSPITIRIIIDRNKVFSQLNFIIAHQYNSKKNSF